MEKPELFRLESSDDYCGFGLDPDMPSRLGRRDIHEDLDPGYEASETCRDWEVPFWGDTWIPPRVEGVVAKENDAPFINLLLPVFSKRACDALGDLIFPNGELLPLAGTGEGYFFYNIRNVIDALDHDGSICAWFDPPTRALAVKRYEFKEQVVRGHPIFRFIEHPTSIVVDRKFVERVDSEKLRGFSFFKIWPPSKNEEWEKCRVGT